MANVTTYITIRSSAGTHDPISGASVFKDGVGIGSTNDIGQLIVSFPESTSYGLSAKASGFTDASLPSLSTQQTSTILYMDPVTAPIIGSVILTIVPENSAVGNQITFDNSGSSISVTYNIGGVTVPNLKVGTQTITGTIEGYEPITSTVEVQAGTPQSNTVVLTATSGGDQQQQQQTGISPDPDTSIMLPTLTPVLTPEFIAPNTGQGTYFTMTQARMYIGKLFIDELNDLRFVLQDNKIPVYGYSSRFYDTMAQGKSIVQGQFSINFISEGYLYTVLKSYKNTITQGAPPVDSVLSAQRGRMLSLVSQLRNPDPKWTPDQFTTAKSEIQALAASLGPTAIDAANADMRLTDTQQLQNGMLGLPGGDYPNGVYQDVGFDVVLEYTGGGRTITRRLENCNLISNESVMDHSGVPITDCYGFTARRLR